MSEPEPKQPQYDHYFRKAQDYFLRLKNEDDRYNLEDMKAHLDTLYAQEGNDWVGKGELIWMKNAAFIAACEKVYVDWKEELKREAQNE